MRWQGAIAPEAVCERSQPASEACPSAAGTGSPECEALGTTTNCEEIADFEERFNLCVDHHDHLHDAPTLIHVDRVIDISIVLLGLDRNHVGLGQFQTK